MSNQHRATLASASKRIRRSARFAVEGLEGRVLLSAGDPDPAFGTGGKLLVSDGSPGAYHQVQATAVQSDGKILLAGSAGLDANHLNTFFLERLDANGTVDLPFGTNGIALTSFGSGIALGTSLVITSNGSIVVGGTYEPDSTPATAEFALAQYTSGGLPDGTFGSGGKVLTHIAGNQQLSTVSLAPGNKLVAVGVGTFQDPAHPTDPAYSAPVYDIARYNSDGTPDMTLNGTGTVYRQFGGNADLNNIYNSNFAAGAVQSDGMILVGGHFQNDLAVWRFNANGSLDTSFGLAGRAIAPLPFFSFDGFQTASVSKMLVEPNGQILLAGTGYDENANRTITALGRVNADGSIDTSFGTGGVIVPASLIAPSNVRFSVGGLQVQTDGKIVLEQTAPTFSPFQGFIAQRYLPNGTVDPTFNSNQIEYFPEGYNGITSTAGAMTANGSILIVGNDNNTQGATGIFITRLQNDGTLAVGASALPASVTNPSGTLPGDPDPTFGVFGRTEFNDPAPVELPTAITTRVKATAVLSDGKILMAGSIGTVANGGQGQFYLERLNADGTIDTSFGTNGSVAASIGNYSFATAILVQSDGRIILGGATVDNLPNISSASFAMARYEANGTPDTTFGSAGKEITDFPGNEEIDSMAFGPSGTIVAAGSFFNYPDVGFDIARYTSSGLPDTSFNSTGMLSRDLGQTGGNSRPTAVAVQTDGKIVIGSHVNQEYAVYRFNANGLADGSFGTSGMATTTGVLFNTPSAILGAITNLVIQPDGKILAAGQTTTFDYGAHSLVRFNSNGSLDTGFGVRGAVRLSENAFGGIVQSDIFSLAGLLLQPNGEIVLVGNQRSDFADGLLNGGGAPLIRKFLPDGTADPYFAPDQDPYFIPPPPWLGTVVEGAALAPSGNLILAADVFTDRSANALHWTGVARYLNNADYFNVSSLADDGSAGTMRSALAAANAVSPGAVIGFQPGLSGTINLGSDIALAGHSDSTLWLKGPGANVLNINGAIDMDQSVTVSGLTLLSGGIITYNAQTYQDSIVHGMLHLSVQSINVQRSTMLGDGAWGNLMSSGQNVTFDTSTITGYTSSVLSNILNLKILNSTISGNGGYTFGGNNPTVVGSIVVGNGSAVQDHADVFGVVTSLGHNLIGIAGSSTGWTSTDLQGTAAHPIDAMLLPLGIYGGTTPTMPPKPGSPAIDAGDSGTASITRNNTDQRGILPRNGSQMDIGSVETSYIVLNGTSAADAVTLHAGFGQMTVEASDGNTGVVVPQGDPLATLTINGVGGADSIALDYDFGNPLPHTLKINGAFTVSGMLGTNPLAGTTIDLGRNTVFFSYATGSSPVATIQQALQAGFGGGTWAGSGAGATGAIVSSAAAVDPNKLALGYADSADGYVTGQPSNTVEIRFTGVGDTNLDGVVSYADALRMAANFNATGSPAWDRGNFNYDNSINATDAILLARNYLSTVTSPAAAPSSATALTTPSTSSSANNVSPPSTDSVSAKHHVQAKRHSRKH